MYTGGQILLLLFPSETDSPEASSCGKQSPEIKQLVAGEER